jgi:hypothetical protein
MTYSITEEKFLAKGGTITIGEPPHFDRGRICFSGTTGIDAIDFR